MCWRFIALAAAMLQLSTAANMQEQRSSLHDRQISKYNSDLDNFLRSIELSPAAIPASAKTTGGVTLTCAILSAINETQVLIPEETAAYVAAAEENWSQTAWGTPACIHIPVNNKGVATALKIVQQTKTLFAVRSGGHSPSPHFANIDNGLLISLDGFKDLHYDPVTETQRSGFGNRWQDVYNYTSQFGRIVVGGRTGTVGLGLTLGGGLSHLSNQYGWPSQNVVSYEIVLANGTAVTASATEHANLYQAVKAGSSNFGIVTHVIQKAYPLGKVWGGTIAFPASASKQFMAAVAEYQRVGQLDQKSAILPYMAPVNDTILVTFCYLDGVDHPDAFAPFYRLPILFDTTAIFENFYGLASLPLPVAIPRYIYAAMTMYYDEAAYQGLLNLVYSAQDEVKKLQGGTLLFTPQPISRSMVQKSRALGPDPMNIQDRAQIWVLAEIGYNLAEDDAEARRIIEKIVNKLNNYARSRRLYDPFIFLNDAAYFQDPLHSYGQGNLRSMKAAQKVYDPTKVFQKLLPGGFKLGN